MNQLDYFFSPKSIAVVGASRNPSKIGHVVFRNFIEGKFKGRLYPVNPNAEELFGHKCHKSILEIKGRIDLAIITIPAALVLEAIDQCGKKKIPAVIIITAGFRETGNADLEEKLKGKLEKYRIRAMGPNCLGVYDPYSDVDTFFLPRYKLVRPARGEIAFISQSGATGSVTMDWMAMKNYKISKFISYGNAADVDESELVEYLAKDPKTKVICCYFEGVSRGRRFFEVAKKTRKPIIVLKGGTTEAGTRAVASHTGSLAGSAAVYASMFSQTGIIQAADIEQVFDYARVLSTQPIPKGNRVQVITNGGGFGVLTTDWLIKNGLVMAQMDPKSMDKIRKVSPPYVTLKNPIDLTGDTDAERYRVAISAAMDDPGVDMLITIILLQVPNLSADIIDILSEFSNERKKPMIVISSGGRYTEVLKKSMEDFGIPTFSYPQGAAEALKALYDFSRKKAA
ncbi:MAG: CoA-binding protein [Candidatus Aenigmarchaeota archaeon]|nr:CoA-binding protein [Candidatus Aenigmarchaeota archaeon]